MDEAGYIQGSSQIRFRREFVQSKLLANGVLKIINIYRCLHMDTSEILYWNYRDINNYQSDYIMNFPVH